MGFKVEIKRSGSLDPDKLIERMTALAQGKVLDNAKKRLVGISCPEHGTIPEPQLEPQSNGFQIRVGNICCPAFGEVVRAKLIGEAAE